MECIALIRMLCNVLSNTEYGCASGRSAVICVSVVSMSPLRVWLKLALCCSVDLIRQRMLIGLVSQEINYAMVM